MACTICHVPLHTMNSWFGRSLTAVLLLFLFLSCSKESSNKIQYTVSIHPAGLILQELTKGRAEVRILVPPSVSIHTFTLRPSDMLAVEKSRAFFYVSDQLDRYILPESKIPAFAMMELIDKKELIKTTDPHNKSETYDVHFWLDPERVRRLLPLLEEKLCIIDPEGCAVYRSNLIDFSSRLAALHIKVSEILKTSAGSNYILFHPSFSYFFQRYNLNASGYVESSPGVEPSVQNVVELIKKAKNKKTSGILYEPQFSNKPALVIAKDADLKIILVDPLGSILKENTYEGLILFNAEALAGKNQ